MRAVTIQQFEEEQRQRRDFMADLRAAGWRSIGHGVYTHPDGGECQVDEYRDEWGCTAWEWYESRGEMPEVGK